MYCVPAITHEMKGVPFRTHTMTRNVDSLVQRFGGLTDTAGQTVVDEGGLEHLRESGVDIHHTSSSDAGVGDKERRRGDKERRRE